MRFKLENGARVGVIGGGPSGSLFSYFVLEMASRIGLELQVEIYEPRNFFRPAPQGCNMCGGVISESLVQLLAVEGINLPPTVVQRGIDSYVMHMDVGTSRIETPRQEKRIASVYRGAGPRGIREIKWESFDGYLLNLAVAKGARVIPERVVDVQQNDGRYHLKTRPGLSDAYELIGVAAGVNSSGLRLFQHIDLAYQPPAMTKTAIREYYLGEETIEQYLGSSMHVFLLDIPRLEFAAIIPKGDYATVCLLGEDIDAELLQAFLNAPQVKACFPPDWEWGSQACQCSPRLNVHGAVKPYADRIVFIGDSGVTRLYKDGIGAAYRAAKAAATTAVFQGVSAVDFEKHYWPACRSIARDNAIGRYIFAVTRLIQRVPFARRALLRMIVSEQKMEATDRRMSMVLWDTFTGSAPYLEVFLRTLHPAFWSRFLGHLAASVFR